MMTDRLQVAQAWVLQSSIPMMDDDFQKYKESITGKDSYAILAEYRKRNVGNDGDHSHAWRGSWYRPVKLDERKEHPFTIARMTDHNVRGRD